MDVFELLVWLQEHPYPWEVFPNGKLRYWDASRAVAISVCPLCALPSEDLPHAGVLLDAVDGWTAATAAIRATLLAACGLADDTD